MVEPPEHETELIVDPPQRVGVWADQAVVTCSPDAVNLDFLREDSLVPARLILVARVTISSRETARLMQRLEAGLSAYAQASLEQEFPRLGDDEVQTDE